MCLKEYWSLHRCIKHVDRASKYCKQLYKLRNFEYDEALAIRAEEEAAIHRRQLEAEGRRNKCGYTNGRAEAWTIAAHGCTETLA